MNAIIVSDLHIGSRYFLFHKFKSFIESIPSDYELIINGDLIDNPKNKLTHIHQRIFDLIIRLSYRRKVIWIQGNHDYSFTPDGIGKIEFKPIYKINNSLLIAHGHNFDQIMPMSKMFMKAFELLHKLRIFLGAHPEHVADYAKRWEWFYKVLLRNVMKNAVIYAKENGCDAVACGHTHYPDDRYFKGVRYMNSGAWTESPAFYIVVNDRNMILKPFGDYIETEIDEPLNQKAVQAA